MREKENQNVIDRAVSYAWWVYGISGRFIRSVESSAKCFGLDPSELMDIVKSRQNEARRKKREAEKTRMINRNTINDQ